MRNKVTTIIVDPESELARTLDDARDSSIRLIVRDVQYRLSRENDEGMAPFDVDQLRRSMDQYAGSWSDLDGEALKEHIYRAREEGSRPVKAINDVLGRH